MILYQEITMFKATESAIQEIEKIRVNKSISDQNLRISIKGGGCSGFNYLMDFTLENREKDKVFEYGGLKILIDPKSYLFLVNVTLDYNEDLMKRGFVWKNTAASSTCGCGQSFSA